MGREYLGVSIKHTRHGWKIGKPLVLWGDRRTADEEPRRFGGYTYYPKNAELYEVGEFSERGYPTDCVKEEPVPFTMDICKKWKEFDTVLVSEKEILSYYKNCYLALERPEEDE